MSTVRTARAVTINRLDPADDAAVAAYFALRTAAAAQDHPGHPLPCPLEHAVMARRPWPGDDREIYLAVTEHGEPAGALMVDISLRDNLDSVGADIVVHPEHRRAGIGRMLAERLQEVARTRGRHLVLFETPDDSPGAAFADTYGAERALPSRQSVLELDRVDDATLAGLEADAVAHADGYSLVQWSGSTPEGHLDDIAVLETRMSTDAPLGTLEWEEEDIDAGRVRERDQLRIERGNRSWTTAVRHDATGRLVGSTTLVVRGTHRHDADQWETIVLHEHRGHRLGTWIKMANLRATRSAMPELERVWTWNASSNAHMLAINIAMGFRPERLWTECQVRLPEVAPEAGSGRGPRVVAQPRPPQPARGQD
jgi:GNAT superfamily N-acetyltransferase